MLVSKHNFYVIWTKITTTIAPIKCRQHVKCIANQSPFFDVRRNVSIELPASVFIAVFTCAQAVLFVSMIDRRFRLELIFIGEDIEHNPLNVPPVI